MNRRTILLLIVALVAIALVATSGWAARDFTKWCGGYQAWFKQVDAFTFYLRILLGAGLVCLVAGFMSQRNFSDKRAALLFGVMPFLATFAFLALGWLFKVSTEKGFFSGIAITCLTDTRPFGALVADALSNLWRNHRALLAGDAVVAVALLVECAWIAIRGRRG